MEVLQYLLDDVSLFLTTIHNAAESVNSIVQVIGCINVLKAFIVYVSGRESEYFRLRKCDNQDSVTLTTIHQSKGLDWDTVFIVKVRRQVLQPSRFLREIPHHLLETQEELMSAEYREKLPTN
ncbi:hypothetical protein OROGR_025744 [Orobanche gracilis]